jgi:predicted N-formylglutamate amidohydrolase
MSDSAPFEIDGKDRPGPFLITCDHALNHVPDWVNGGDLGLPAEDMGRHIAYDIGAAGVVRHLAQRLNSPAVLSRFSRLVIDPNRGEDDPTLIMQLYDGTIIPGNRWLDAAEREARLERLYRPYHSAVEQMMEGHTRAYVAIHSFTPRLTGRPPRPWHITVLTAGDRRLAEPLLQALDAQGDICSAENEPYDGDLKGDSVDKHALQRGAPNVLIEIRQDLIDTPDRQVAWAERLAPLLQEAVAKI